MRIRIADIKLKATQRPSGYVDEVLSKGQVMGDFLVIDPKSYNELMRKYSPNVGIKSGGCCAKPVLKNSITNTPTQSIASPDLPPIRTQIRNATKAVGRVLSNAISRRTVVASHDKVEERRSICNTCEFFIEKSGRCAKCGCFLKVKLQLESEHCPENKW
jgi:hypothetical protein